MNDVAEDRSPVLLTIAVGMGLTVVALIIWTALSQNLFGWVATIEVYDAVDGSERWTAQFDVGYPPDLTDNGVMLISTGSVRVLGADGDVAWSTSVPGAMSGEWAEGYVAIQRYDRDAGDKVVVLDATDGAVLWERRGSLLHAGAEIVTTRRGGNVVVLASRSGERIVRLENPRHYVAGDTAVAALNKGTLTVHTADGDTIDVLNSLPAKPALEAIEEGVVVLSRKSTESGRTAVGYHIETGAELWQQRLADYRAANASLGTVEILPSGRLWLPPVSAGESGDAGMWMLLPAEGPREAIAAAGSELATIHGAVRYVHIAEQTFAVDAASNEVLWTRSGRSLIAATDGLAAVKYAHRYTILSATSGKKLAVFPRERDSSIHAVAGGFVIDTGPRIVLVESDATTRALYEGIGVLEAASARYAVVRAGASSAEQIQLTVLDVSTGEEVLNRQFDRVYDVSLDGEMMEVRHWQSATTVNLTTGATKTADRPTFRTTDLPPVLVVVALNPDGTRLLWTTEVDALSSVRAIGDTIVISKRTRKPPVGWW